VVKGTRFEIIFWFQYHNPSFYNKQLVKQNTLPLSTIVKITTKQEIVEIII